MRSIQNRSIFINYGGDRLKKDRLGRNKVEATRVATSYRFLRRWKMIESTRLIMKRKSRIVSVT